jgi:hypothetical protein
MCLKATPVVISGVILAGILFFSLDPRQKQWG